MTDAGRGAGSAAIALLVCTRDRAASLAPTLAVLGALRAAQAWELVLVDNGSRDGTPALLARFAEQAARAPAVPGAPVAVTVVREERAGLAHARNAGIRASQAPLLCFTDDDCYPAADLLDRWAAVFADPAVGYGGGRILLHDPADFPITVRTEAEPVALAPGAYVLPGLVQGANLAFRRDVLCAIGGFDPAMGPGAPFNCEDVDAAARASAWGAAGGYFPGPTVEHHHRRRAARDVAALERSYDHGRGAYHVALLLRRGSRRHALGVWYRRLRALVRAPSRRTAARTRRELLGAAHYAAHRVVRPRAGDPARERSC